MLTEKDYLEVNQEILGGITSAVSHGESLKEAMMSFYRSGYEKAEIELAAKVFLESQTQETLQKINIDKKTTQNVPAEKTIDKKEQNPNSNLVKERPKIVNSMQEYRAKKQMAVAQNPIEKNKLQPVQEPQNKTLPISPQSQLQEASPSTSFQDYEKRLEEKASVAHQKQESIQENQNMKPSGSAPQKDNELEEIKKEMNKPAFVSKPYFAEKNKTKQYVSSYAEVKKKPNNVFTLILIFILLFLVGALVSVFLFKEELIVFVNRIFNK